MAEEISAGSVNGDDADTKSSGSLTSPRRHQCQPEQESAREPMEINLDDKGKGLVEKCETTEIFCDNGI